MLRHQAAEYSAVEAREEWNTTKLTGGEMEAEI